MKVLCGRCLNVYLCAPITFVSQHDNGLDLNPRPLAWQTSAFSTQPPISVKSLYRNSDDTLTMGISFNMGEHQTFWGSQMNIVGLPQM